jgi:5-methylcytosine-specific restriction endonuclease McrA
MNTTKALKLDSSFRPVEIIDSVEALVLCLIGKARAVENYSKEICSVAESFKLPAVIALTRYVKYRFSHIACNKQNVLWRDQNQCQYCKKILPTEKLTLDHVIPKSRGGENNWENLVTACEKCNQRKGNRTTAVAKMFPLCSPSRPKDSILRTVKKENISPKWIDYLWNFS